MSFPRYPEYKDSGVESLGQVPAHWDVTRLRFVASLNPSKSEVAWLRPDEPVSFLPMEAVGDDGSLSLETTRPLEEVVSGYSYFREGDVTIAKITPCFENGKGAVMRGLHGGVGFGTTELTVVRPRPGAATAEYLHYLFNSVEFRRTGEAHMYGAGGQKRVPDAFVRNFICAMPPPTEQSAICTFLDRETAKIDALIAEQQRLIELLTEKRQAVISHAVTKGLNPDAPMKPSGVEWLGNVPAHWEVLRVKTVSSRTTSGPRGWSERLGDDGALFVQSGDLNDTLGLGLDDVRDTPVFLPPLPEQRTIIESIHVHTRRLDALAVDARRAIDLLQERRTALISAAVTGQIDVRPESMRQSA